MRIKLVSIVLIGLVFLSCSDKAIFKYQGNYDISVMSFNLRYDEVEDGENQWTNRKEACLKMLKKEQPSVFGIQEGLYNQVSYLNSNLNQYSYVGVGRDDGYSGGEFAAIFYLNTQFELLQDSSFWLSETPDYPSLGWDANNIRIVTWAKLKDKNTNETVYIFNTHFDHKGKTAQAESAKLLVKKIHEITNSNDKVFITGDFNVLISNEIFEELISEFYSARRFAEYTDNFKSFNAFGRWILSRNIDFIFYKNVRAVAFRTICEDYGVPFISDHYPIISHYNYK